MVGKLQWLDNDGFVRAIVGMAGFKSKPENENRGVSFKIISTWDSQTFQEPLQVALGSEYEIYIVPTSRRLSTFVLQRIAREFSGYHLPANCTTVQAFVAQPDRRIYIENISARQEGMMPIMPGTIVYVPRPIGGASAFDIEQQMRFKLHEANKAIKQLRGWGWV